MTTIYERAAEIQERANAAYDQIRRHPYLSVEGRQRAMAPHLIAAKKQIEQLAWSAKTHREARIAQLKRSTFGVTGSDPMSAMSHRDAVARVSDIDSPAKAQFAMQRAIESGDDVMARALGQACLDYGWQQTLQLYIDARPEVGDALNEIAELAAVDQSTNRAMKDAAYLRAPVPDELARHSDYDLQVLADSPMPAPVLPPEPQAARVGGEFG